MDVRSLLAMTAVLAAAGAMAAPAYAQILPGCPECTIDDLRAEADRLLQGDIPISVWTDAQEYGHSDTIRITGMVANADSQSPIILRATSPLNSVVWVAQIAPGEIGEDGSFGASINTASPAMKYDGTYIIQVNYGSASDRAAVELTGGVAFEPRFAGAEPVECGADELDASGYCVPYTITGGTVTGASINIRDMSIVIGIDSDEGGVLTFSPAASVQDGIFMVLVDDQEWDDAVIDGNMATVPFPPGTERIEVIGTFVIPEFGAIAAVVLAVAIISVVAVTSRSRLGVMPRI